MQYQVVLLCSNFKFQHVDKCNDKRLVIHESFSLAPVLSSSFSLFFSVLFCNKFDILLVPVICMRYIHSNCESNKVHCFPSISCGTRFRSRINSAYQKILSKWSRACWDHLYMSFNFFSPFFFVMEKFFLRPPIWVKKNKKIKVGPVKVLFGIAATFWNHPPNN